MWARVYCVTLAVVITYCAAANLYRSARQISGQRVGLKCPEHFSCLVTLAVSKPQCQCQQGYQQANWTAYVDCFNQNNLTDRCPQQRPSQLCFYFSDESCYTAYQSCNDKYYGYFSPLESRKLRRLYDLCTQKFASGGSPTGMGGEDYK